MTDFSEPQIFWDSGSLPTLVNAAHLRFGRARALAGGAAGGGGDDRSGREGWQAENGGLLLL